MTFKPPLRIALERLDPRRRGPRCARPSQPRIWRGGSVSGARRGLRHGVAGWALLVLLTLAAAAQAPPVGQSVDLRDTGRYTLCEVISIAPGEANAAWTLVDGFVPDRRERKAFAWVDGEARALLLLEGGAARTLRLEARSSRPGLELSARLGDVKLAAQPLDRAWREIVWELPASALDAGPELLELTAPALRQAQGGQRIGVAVSAIRVGTGAACGVPARIVERPPGGESVGMAPGSWLVGAAGVGAARQLELAFRGSWPATRLDLYCVAPAGVIGFGSRVAGRGGDRRFDGIVDLPEGCSGAARLALAARGPDWVNLETARGASAGLVGRRGVDRLELAAATALLAGLALVLARRGVRPPLARWAPWADVVLLVALAAGLRLLLFSAYPYAGFSGDEVGYVNGAKALVADPSLFWSDTSWHGWQTYMRPPGYYLFLAGVLGPLGGDRETALLIQGGLSAVAAGATYLIAYPLFGRGAALAAGGIFALYAGSIATFTRVLSEPLFMALALPALAALAWVCRSPSWKLAVAAGALFAVAALVRPAPVQFAPMAALLLLAIHGPRRGWRPAAALLLTMVALLAPWYLRTARIHGHWVGLETVSTANLLQFNPDERFVAHADLDLADRAQFNEYYRRLKLANDDGQIERRRGELTRAIVADRLARPAETLARFAANTGRFFSPLPDSYLRWILSDENAFRVGRLTDVRNLQFFAIVLLGAIGVAAHLRDRGTWPLLLWFLFNFAVVNVLVQPSVRYRLGILPVLMVFAGWTVARGLARFARPARGSSPVAA